MNNVILIYGLAADVDIMIEFGMSRATFYRKKKGSK